MKKLDKRRWKSIALNFNVLAMKLTLFLTILSVLQVSAGAFSQKSVVSINMNNTSVKEVILEIQSQSDFRFFYNDDMPGLQKKVSVNVKDADVVTVMKELSDQSGIGYQVMEDNLIVLKSGEIAEKVIVKGTVTSESDNFPLPGVNVVIKGTAIGTITGVDGSFLLEVESGVDILIFSFVGYDSKEVPVGTQSLINVTLSESSVSLDEVIVTALNISRDKKSLGYAVSEIGGDEVNVAKENNVVNSLAGRVAGLQITQSPTGVDGSTRVVLRGVSSLLGNNRPLFVIDGIPMDASFNDQNQAWGGYDRGDALSDINPEDIETINVLKGPGAAAAYGSRGANGVVLITTKNGSGRKGIGVSFSSNYTSSSPMVYPDLQNEYGTGGFGVYPTVGGDPAMPDKNDPWSWSYGPALDGEVRTDWAGNNTPFLPQEHPMKTFLRNGSSFVNSIALESGNDKSSLRASITTQNSAGLYPSNDLKRQTLNLRGVSQQGKHVELDGKLTYIHHKVNNRPYLGESGANAGLTLTIFPRNISTDDFRNNMTGADGNELTWTNDNTYNNPYWALENILNEDEKHRMQAMFSVKIDFLKKFSLLGRSGLDYTNQIFRETVNQGTRTRAQGRGSMSNAWNNRIEWNSDVLLTYKEELGSFLFDISIGGNYRYNQYKSIDQYGEGMKVADFFHISNYNEYRTGEGFSEKAVNSVYGLGQVAFKNYLYFDFTLRNDWSSTLPAESNSYFYHSENLSFMFTDAFDISSSILTTGKVRGSYARVGNDTGPYETKQYYEIGQSPLPYPIGYISPQLAFYDFRPEITDSWELGTNLGFFLNRLEVDFTYYNSLSKDQIMNVPLLPSTGYENKKQNAGEISNKGFEFQINGVPIQNKDFRWNVIWTFSKNKSMVEKLYGDLENVRLNNLWHASIQAIPGEEYGVILGTDYKRDNFGNKLIDDRGYAQKGEQKIMGSINPDFLTGLSNVFTYKDLTFSFLIDVQKGGELYSWGKAYKSLYGTGEETLEGRAEWYATHDPDYNHGVGLPGVEPQGYIESGVNEKNGQPNDTPIQPIYRWFNIWTNNIVTESILDATNVRMREMVFSYSIPRRVLGKAIENITISVTGRNLFFFYKNAAHIDPESGYSSGNTGNGFEHSALPTTRSYGVNFRMNF